MTDCELIGELLPQYADGEALERSCRTVEDHLAACKPCRGELRMIAALKSAVRSAAVPAMPAELKTALFKEAARRRSRPAAMRFKIGAGLAAAFAAAAIAVLVRVAGRRDDRLPLDVVLAAHGDYIRSMPLSGAEAIVSRLPERWDASAGGRRGS